MHVIHANIEYMQIFCRKKWKADKKKFETAHWWHSLSADDRKKVVDIWYGPFVDKKLEIRKRFKLKNADLIPPVRTIFDWKNKLQVLVQTILCVSTSSLFFIFNIGPTRWARPRSPRYDASLGCICSSFVWSLPTIIVPCRIIFVFTY